MKTLRNVLAVAAVAVAGIASTASAAPFNPNLNVNKIAFRFCVPHVETKVTHLGSIFRTHLDRVTVIYVNRYCQKRVIRVYYKLHRGIVIFRNVAKAA